jgi:branched-chain amino acid transport system substrate-binding protein
VTPSRPYCRRPWSGSRRRPWFAPPLPWRAWRKPKDVLAAVLEAVLLRGLTRVLPCALALCLAAPLVRADEYVVHILTPHTGPWNMLGQSMRNGVALALEQAEDRGQFREGVRLSLKDYDDNLAPEVLAQKTEKLVRETDAILVIGPMFSPQAEAMAVSATRRQFPFITPAVSEGITATSAWAFRTSASPHRLLDAMTRGAINHFRARKIAVLYAAGNTGFESQAKTISQTIAQMGRLTVGELGIGDEEESFAEAAASLKTVAPDVIFFAMDAGPAAVIASRLRRAGLSEQSHMVFGPAAARPELLEVGREYVEGALVAADYLPELPGSLNQAFVDAYRGRFAATPDRWAGIGYATGLIAAAAVRNAGPAPTRALIREAIERGTALELPLGQQKWTLGLRHEPQYLPALFVIRAGKFVALEIKP